MQTIVIEKNYGSRVHHGVRNEVGGFFGTSDCGWSFKQAINHEKKNLMHFSSDEDYQVEVNGIIKETGKISQINL